MNILRDFIKSAVIIDDNNDELEPLANALVAEDIFVDKILYNGIDTEFDFTKNRNIFFFDLVLNGNANQISVNVATILSFLSKFPPAEQMGLYGIVVWTKHTEDVIVLKERISQAIHTTQNSNEDHNDSEFEEENTTVFIANPPTFIVSLDKTKYIREGYQELSTDLEERLADDKAALFISNWLYSVERAQSNLINAIYKIIPDYAQLTSHFMYLLQELAKNHTGIDINNLSDYQYLTQDAYKAFDELLYSELYVQQKNAMQPLFDKVIDNPYESKADLLKIYAAINTCQFLDNSALSQRVVVPGNIYLIKEKIDKDNEQNDSTNILRIAIELTPPCDFANNKAVVCRMVEGYIHKVDMTTNDNGELKTKISTGLPQSSCMSKEAIGPVIYENEVVFLVFSFSDFFSEDQNNIINDTRYSIKFRSKPKLFAHLLQRFSSHASRLGLSALNLPKSKKK